MIRHDLQFSRFGWIRASQLHWSYWTTTEGRSKYQQVTHYPREGHLRSRHGKSGRHYEKGEEGES